jgi:peptidoglycan hydrolase-like protein with peptidoglycan-binding domain
MLYTVDTRPVVLMAGQLPAYRAFQAGMTPGADVAQLEQNLVAMGYLHVVPDNRFTAATGTAIRAWQRAQGVPRTGSVDRSVVLFAPGAVRVATWSSRVGAQVTAGAELFTTSGTDKVVDVDLNLNDQQLAVVGARLTVTLPDGTHVPATVTAVGEAVERAGAAGATGTVVRPVQAALGDQTPAAPFSRADVTVSFTSTLAQDVLTVPVAALVAIDATTFGVEVLDADGGTTTVPVTVGVFASGRVQVTGKGIVAGLDVVVPQA